MKMKKIKRISVTKEGLEELKKKLVELEGKRPEAVDTLSDARKLGDLSENALYSAAKMRLRSIDSQIFRIKTQIKLADVITGSKNGTVGLGSKVIISDGVREKSFYIVGEYEADPVKGKISGNSPIGKSLLGKKVGDTFRVKAPSGDIDYKVIKII